MKRGVTLDIFYPCPPDRVWEALVDSRALAEWLMPNTFQPVLGHRFQFSRSYDDRAAEIIECEVTELEPPRRLSSTWREPGSRQIGLVTWVLEPVAHGTRVRLTHRTADAGAAPRAGAAADAAAAHVWKNRLSRLG